MNKMSRGHSHGTFFMPIKQNCGSEVTDFLIICFVILHLMTTFADRIYMLFL